LSILEAIVSVYILRALVNRRASLVPPALRDLRFSKQGGVNALLILFTIGLTGCDYEGIDGTIFGAEAERAGRAPTDSIVDFSQGEFGLAMTILILFGLGFVAGRSWERLAGTDNDALSR
jgi:hypothetical protein